MYPELDYRKLEEEVEALRMELGELRSELQRYFSANGPGRQAPAALSHDWPAIARGLLESDHA